jgi:3-oxoacyl-[acyl-carrier protein] reductase
MPLRHSHDREPPEEDDVELELKDKVALVTGASRGIGRAIALALAREGAQVALCSRKAGDLDDAAARIRQSTGGQPLCVPGDLSTLAGVEAAVTATRNRFGRIDILINNAGAIRGGDFLKIPDAQWSEDWSLKLLGYIRMARAVFPLMQAQGGGRICNIVGAAARNPTPAYLTGGAANAALINFTKGLADLGGPSKILVTAVSPAATATERWDDMIKERSTATGRSVDDLQAEAAQAYALGRIATPEDVADLVAFLVSARASFLTGLCITVDGGATRGVYL